MAEEYSLGPRETLEEAVQAVKGTLGMGVCENTDVVAATARSHTLLLAGSLVGQAGCLARIRFGMDASGSVAMQVAARGDTPAVAQLIHDIITS